MLGENQNIPRPEYPRPQLVRDKWINLNGNWEFEIDNGKSGRERKLYEAAKLGGNIIVPFCPESKLSGIEHKDFMAAVWYRKDIIIPDDWLSERVLLHFWAVDYDTEVWVNGKTAGTHRGGYTSFCFDITRLLQSGTNTIIVCADDDVRSGLQPRGKQSSEYYSHGCEYTRTTGIWQTVWLECVPKEYIVSLKYFPDPANSCLHVEAGLNKSLCGYKIEAEASYNKCSVGTCSTVVTGNTARFSLKLAEIHLWDVGKPELYDLTIALCDNKTIDEIKSYFGLRIVSFDNNAISINGKKVFQRLVLDQGFYPDGIYTAPTEEALIEDIRLALNMGFNGARLHEKVFEPRYLYWADKMGYLVWGEHANWGLDITKPMGLERFLPEWIEAVERDFNHPSIVGWCPFNETWDINGSSITGGIRQDDEVLKITYNVTKSIDKTRPVIDTSGNFHVITDIFDIHDYEQNPAEFTAKFEPMKNGGEPYIGWHGRQKYEGQPYFVSEYGGIWWSENQEEGWGYGNRPGSKDKFLERYRGLTEALLKHPRICAFCYTQLYDVEQEVNGLYTYFRMPKFDPDIIKNINIQKAAIEI